MLIGFIGRIGSGKTTAADFLVENYEFSKHNFKDALDNELFELYPNVLDRLAAFSEHSKTAEELISEKPTPLYIRELKQKHGTEVRRSQDEGYWVKKWIETYLQTFNGNVCVDDVRFMNEVDTIKRFRGIIVRIERTDEQEESQHVSETELDGFEADYTITADPGDLMTIQMALEDIVVKRDDIGSREEDGDDSSSYAEYAEEAGTEGSE